MRKSDESAIDERLRLALDAPLDVRRDERVDMSPAAVTARVKELCEMSRVCLELAAARPADSD